MGTNNFYIPYKIELLFDFFPELNVRVDKYYSSDEKKEVLKWVRKLLEERIIFAGEFGDDKKLKRWDLSIDKIIDKISANWKEDIDFPGFYNIVWFGYEDWYINALKKEGYNDELDWKWFLDNKIGEIEVWVKENRPKNVNEK